MEKEKMNRLKKMWHEKSVFLISAFLLFVIPAVMIATPVESKPRVQKDVQAEVLTEFVDEAAPKQRLVSLTFKQMGAWSTIRLRGVEGSRTLSFPIRADEVVVAAKVIRPTPAEAR